MNTKLAVNGWLLIIAIIWGLGFVPQKIGMDYLGPAAFNAMRFAFGAMTLLPVIWWLRRRSTYPATKATVMLGAALGFLLFVGALLQQLALLHTSVANVAFITGLYVIVVPVIGFFLGLRYAAVVWSGGLVAIVGLYLMTGGMQGASVKGDSIALIGALIWAAHIMVLSRLAGQHPQVRLSAYQFAFCTLFSLVYAYLMEDRLLPVETIGYLWPLLNGVIVVGVAYTLQVIVMDKADPFAAALILSLEAVFGALAGYWVFNESVTAAALSGAGLMLLGCVLAQIPQRA